MQGVTRDDRPVIAIYHGGRLGMLPKPGDAVMSHPWIKFAHSRPLPEYLSAFAGHEPLLADVLRDPIIHRLMACDGIEMSAMEALILTTQRRLQ